MLGAGGFEFQTAWIYGRLILMEKSILSKAIYCMAVLGVAVCTGCTPSEPVEKEVLPASPVVVNEPVEQASAVASPEVRRSVVRQGWLTMRCENGGVRVRYDGDTAIVAWQGKTLTLPLDEMMSNEDLTTFGDGQYSWTISNLGNAQGVKDYYQEEGGFLVRHDSETVAGVESIVDNIELQGCMPVQG